MGMGLPHHNNIGFTAEIAERAEFFLFFSAFFAISAVEKKSDFQAAKVYYAVRTFAIILATAW